MSLKFKRIISVGIDVSLIVLILNPLAIFVEMVCKDERLLLLAKFPILVLAVFSLLKKDSIGKDKSLGKRIMKLEVYLNGAVLKDKDLLLKRNLASLLDLPSTAIGLITDGKSAGDDKYETEIREKE